jgi:uncharacterized protein
MNSALHLTRRLFFGCACFCMFACDSNTDNAEKQSTKRESVEAKQKPNPVVYFEIPVTDMDRAIRFYSAVFDLDFEKQIIDKNEMALFPFTKNGSGISGALAKGDIYKPTKNGALVYFGTDNIDETLKLALQQGGSVLFPKTSNGDLGFVAEFEDSEGNRIALHQSLKK